jgi:phospholipid/cholesterol/gamma-HCH transport system substrate-binding protein
MQKQAPTVARLLTMVLFALSCFGLLLFLWLSFGGSIPLKPKGYRFNVAFPQAVQLAQQSDVRVAGISVGKVVKKDISAAHPNTTVATVELDPRFAPLHADAKAILREKTLLGETFVELTPGTAGAGRVADNGWLGDGQVQGNVYLDQVLQAFDPVTRLAFRHWQQDLAVGASGQGQNVNDAFGTLPQFATDASNVLAVLNGQSSALSQLVRNTGVVFQAINRSTTALHDLVVNAGQVFQTTSDEQNALAATFKNFPAFLDQSKATFAKLQTFSQNTDPLIRDLRPVARDLVPTLRDVRALAPDLKNAFINTDPLITASKTGLPALRDVLNGTTPLLGALDPFLAQLNPILQFIELYQGQTAMFLGNSGAAVSGTTSAPQGEVGHYLRQFGPVGQESFGSYAQRDSLNRGNAYVGPNSLQGPFISKNLIIPNYDCLPTGGETPPKGTPPNDTPGCTIDPPFLFQGSLQKFPHVQANNYDTGP